ncbi:hypothetical protein [Kordia sp.]|uniref:hypothetical protein n=1 Tax=Kordia sp. TaxID=1965332 RepID=UPI0025B8B02F|nr:hypothetical protein [Kordia sp.]MCH2194447.1 hypothetical protein [Kordia sp.]
MDFKTFSEIITNASPLVLFIGTSIGLYYYKRLDKIAKLLFYFLIGSLLIDLSSRLLGAIINNNLFLFFVLTWLELFVFMKVYYYLTGKKKLLIGITAFGILYTLIESIYINTVEVNVFQPYAKALGPLFIVIMALIFFFELIRDEENLYKNEGDYFILNSTILCFFSLQFLIFLPLNFLVNQAVYLAGYIFIGNVVFLILFYVYLTYFIWKRGRNRKQ